MCLRPYDADSPLIEDALAVYSRVWPDRDPGEARESFVRNAGYHNFRGFVAVHAGEAIGVGYKARSYPDIPWHDLVAPRLGEWNPALRDAWRLAEEYRGMEVGGQLHDALLAAQPCPRALLSTGVSNNRARAVCERRGWYYVHTAFTFEGQPHPYVITGKEVQL